jgi:hypothetical protein
LASIVYVQRVDTTYDSVDFDDPISTLSYFREIFRICHGRDEDNDRMITDLMLILKRSSDQSAEVQAQHIMRSAAEKIHGVIRELKQDSIVIASEFVAYTMQEAFHNLNDLLYEASAPDDDDDDGIPMSAFYIRNNTKEDAGVSTDYEPLG